MQGALGQRTGWPVPSKLRRGNPVTARWAGWRRGGGCGPRKSISRRPGQHPRRPSWLCGRPLLFLQKMMVPLLLASWCLWKTDEPVISPGTWQPPHSAEGEVRAQADTVQQASPPSAPPPPPSVCLSLSWICVSLTLSSSSASLVGSADSFL